MIRTMTVCLVMLGVVGCATTPARIMLSPQNNWLAIGYDEDRANAILKTQEAAEHHCLQQENKRVQLLSEVTVYQGRFDQTTTEVAKAASEAAWIYGSFESGQVGRAFSSDTDYRTTIEFRCL